MRAISILYLLLVCVGPLYPAEAAPTDPALILKDGDSSFVQESLDQVKIHALYNNGDFEPVIEVLEGFMKRNKSYSHSDSVFLAKHLAVVYTADPKTREKGRYYMYRLLELLPSAKLVDMYVSEEIDRIFDKVREEFMMRKGDIGSGTSGMVQPSRGDRDSVKLGSAVKRERRKRWMPWALAAGGVAVATGVWVAFQAGDGSDAPLEQVNVTVVTPKN